ncbi:MAG: PAS domain S-box protein [Heteroscytonema crispum UTEX LB 1556]
MNNNIDMFAKQVQSLHDRLTELYQDGKGSVQMEADLLLPIAFTQLGIASETLEVTEKKLLQQNEQVAAAEARVKAERQRYQDLFEFIAIACLVTDARGIIQEANCAAATLFNLKKSFLVNKPLNCFMALEERQLFRSQLIQLQELECMLEWTIRIQPRHGDAFDAAVTVASVRDCEGNLTLLRWIIRDITEQKRALLALESHDYDPSQDRPKHFYSKGEIISLEPEKIWLVCQGLVKLSTMNEDGREVLIGLARSSMPFGCSLTCLPTYQAITLSEKAELVCISLQEIAASPPLAQAILPQISDRLRQAELLLAIAGKRHVKDRLYYLLLWLKQQFGQTVAEGTYLSIRLTHQDFADACCTTRVTVTRELSKLQQQGKIKFDSKHHIVFME